MSRVRAVSKVSGASAWAASAAWYACAAVSFVGGGEPPTSCHQRPQPRRCSRRGDGRELLSHRDGIVMSSECDVGLDEIGSDAECLAHRPNATVGGKAVLKQRHGHRRLGPTQGAECSRQRLVGREAGGNA